MPENSQANEYRVILQSVPDDAVDALGWELMLLFPLDRGPAQQVAKSAPIVLVDKLDAAQAASVETYLGCLRRFGAEVIITAESDASLKRLNWPRTPHIAKHPGNIVVCPHCGVRLSIEAVAATVPSEQAPTVEHPEPVRPPVAEKVDRPIARPVQPRPVAPPKPAAPAAAAPAKPAEPPVAPPQPKPADAAKPQVEPPKKAVAPPPVEKPQTAGAWKLSVDEESPASTQKDEQTEDLLDLPPLEAEKDSEEKPAEFAATGGQTVAEAKAPDSTADDNENSLAHDEGTCRVMLIRQLKHTERKPVAALIAKYQGISIEEASKLAGKSIVTIMRNASKERAEECRKEFKTLGMIVQIRE